MNQLEERDLFRQKLIRSYREFSPPAIMAGCISFAALDALVLEETPRYKELLDSDLRKEMIRDLQYILEVLKS